MHIFKAPVDPRLGRMRTMEAALAEPRELDGAREAALRVIANVRRAVSGEAGTVERAVVALLAEGHVLVEDVPGVGKTTLARALARSLDCSFARIQLTPDVLPSDVTGVSVFDQRTSEFAFRPGPVFANIVLADELNRASPRTQSSLLECMQERQVTVDGVARPLAAPFFVIATQNPIEQDGTFPLPEAQLDRFALRLALGYPEPGRRGAHAGRPDRARAARRSRRSAPVADAAELIAAVHACRTVHVAPSLHDYVVALCGATRDDPRLALGASPRAGVTLVRLARAHALVRGRDHVLPDDVKELAPDALAHRLLPAAGAPADVASVVARAARAGARPAVSGARPGADRARARRTRLRSRRGRLRPALRHRRAGAARRGARGRRGDRARLGRPRRRPAHRGAQLPPFAHAGERVRVAGRAAPARGRTQRARGVPRGRGGGRPARCGPSSAGGLRVLRGSYELGPLERGLHELGRGGARPRGPVRPRARASTRRAAARR